jgi:hypothetical protein
MRPDSPAKRDPRNRKCSRRAWGRSVEGFRIVFLVCRCVLPSASGRTVDRLTCSWRALAAISLLALDSLRIHTRSGIGFLSPRCLQQLWTWIRFASILTNPSSHAFSPRASAISNGNVRMSRTIRPCLARALQCDTSAFRMICTHFTP